MGGGAGFFAASALTARLAAAQPQQQAGREQAGEQECGHAGQRIGLGDGHHQGDVEPADCDHVHSIIMH